MVSANPPPAVGRRRSDFHGVSSDAAFLAQAGRAAVRGGFLAEKHANVQDETPIGPPMLGAENRPSDCWRRVAGRSARVRGRRPSSGRCQKVPRWDRRRQMVSLDGRAAVDVEHAGDRVCQIGQAPKGPGRDRGSGCSVAVIARQATTGRPVHQDASISRAVSRETRLRAAARPCRASSEFKPEHASGRSAASATSRLSRLWPAVSREP